MQVELLVDTPEDHTNAAMPVTVDRHGVAAECLVAMRSVAAAQNADDAAVAVDAVLRLIRAHVRDRVATYAVTWPSDDVEIEDLVQEVLLALVAAMPMADLRTEGTVMLWVSTTTFDTLGELRAAATMQVKRARRAAFGFTDVLNAQADARAEEAAHALDAFAVDDLDDDEFHAEDIPNYDVVWADPDRPRLEALASAIRGSDTHLIWLRQKGYLWTDVGRMLGVSVRFAQRRYVIAMEAKLADADRAMTAWQDFVA